MTTEQEQPAPERHQAQGRPQSGDQAPIVPPDFNKHLQEQIARAIQPVLADYRQQFAHAIQTEVETRPPIEGNGASQGAQPGAPQERSEEQLPTVRESAEPTEEPDNVQQAQEQGEAQGIRDRIVARGIGPAVGAGLRLAERQGEQWLEAMIVAGLGALLAESTHAAAQQHAENGLHTLLQKAFDALPSNATTRELRDQTERTLQSILRDALDAVFTEAIRASVQEHGKQASSEVAHGHFKSALQQLEQALQDLLREIVNVLRQQWQRVLRLLLRLVLMALQDSLAPEEGESLKGIQAEPTKEEST